MNEITKHMFLEFEMAHCKTIFCVLNIRLRNKIMWKAEEKKKKNSITTNEWNEWKTMNVILNSRVYHDNMAIQSNALFR